MHLNSFSLYKVLLMFYLMQFGGTKEKNNKNKEKGFTNSISGMVQLLDTEMQLIQSLESYAAELRKKVNALNDLVQELKEEHLKSVNDRERYLFNPLNGFSLIRRMQHDWPQIELYMTQPIGEIHLEVIRHYKAEMPTATDLEEASEAIYRLLRIYDLKAADLVRGILNGKRYETKWKSIDSYLMGLYLFNKKYNYPAGLWLNSSLINYEENNTFNEIIDYGKNKPFELYAENLIQQKRFKEALAAIDQACFLKPRDERLLKRKNETQHLAKRNHEPAKKYRPNIANVYERGCRGEFANKTSKMFCIYNTTTTPFLRLAPLKMEILNLNPYMVLYYDVLSDEEIEHLKNLSIPKLKRALIYGGDNELYVEDNSRTSKLSWLKDNTDEVTKRINERVIDMSGFDLKGSEKLQVQNYGLGGQYEEHHDYFNVTDANEHIYKDGDRIATVLFYLSEVEQGGATVFPELKTAVFPRKGSAVMWYNLHGNLEPNILTLHGSCPVISGSKWVCNKWIRSKAQIFRKLCYK